MHEDIPILNYPRAQGVHPRRRQADRRAVREGRGRVRRQGPAQPGADRRARPALSNATTCWWRSARRTPSPGSSATSASSSTTGTCPRSIPMTMHSTHPNVFFGGDAAFGPKNIIWAVAHGHDAAISIDKLLHGEDVPRPPAARRGAHQPEDGHPRVELRQRHLQRSALPRAAARQGRRAQGRADRGRARLRSEARLSRGRALPQLRRRRRCSTTPLCIECDACVDICPMDCITFTANGEEAELRQRLNAPAMNLTQDLYVSGALKTGRIMVKDEDVCLHCGLCAERCPTGAWDMQKFLSRHDTGRTRMPKPITSTNDFVVKFANVNGSGSASANELFAKSILRMGVPVATRNIFPSNIQGLPTWYEVRVSEAGPSRPARRRRPDGGDEPADLGAGRRLDRARRLSVLRFDQADAAVEVPRRHQRHRHAADRDLQPRPTPTRASGSCSRTSSMSARWRRCSTSSCRRSRS